MITICIPAFDEASTIGLVLWRVRQVFEANPREYEILVCDDASTDATADVLAPYARVMPVTVLRHETRRGYAAALDTLLRAAAQRTRYPRRDAAIILQADLTDPADGITELMRPFDGGADLVVAESSPAPVAPVPVRRLRRVAPWLLRALPRVAGVRDPLGSLRLVRLAVVRDAIKTAGEKPLVGAPGWAANAELLAALAPHARRIETVAVQSRYDLRQRDTRVRAWRDALELLKFARARRAARPA